MGHILACRPSRYSHGSLTRPKSLYPGYQEQPTGCTRRECFFGSLQEKKYSRTDPLHGSHTKFFGQGQLQISGAFHGNSLRSRQMTSKGALAVFLPWYRLVQKTAISTNVLFLQAQIRMNFDTTVSNKLQEG
jgi:hypothetical protein